MPSIPPSRTIRVAVLLAALGASSASAQEAVRFAVVGDTPYTRQDRTLLWQEVVPALGRADYPFIIHVGDFIGGADGCNDDKIRAWRDEMYSWKPGRTFYTPGDNEWTDCDRPKKQSDPNPGTPPARLVLERNLGKPLPELDRLALLRRTFFPAPLDLPDAWQFASQPSYPENARWIVDGVQFATVHLVSTNNGRMQILMDDIQLALARVAARDEANRAWLTQLFREARKQDAGAVVIATQADVTKPGGEGPCVGDNLMNCDAFARFRDQLKRLAQRFDKPVLLVHGDTNPYCLDEAFGAPSAPRLWRLNVSGDYYQPAAHATEVTVAPDNTDAPFSARTLGEDKMPAEGCD